MDKKNTNAHGSDGMAAAAQYIRVSLRPKMLEEKKEEKNGNEKSLRNRPKKIAKKKVLHSITTII